MPDSDMPADREEYLSRLGVVLAYARRAAGLSQEEAAAEMGVSTAAFTRWEGGTNGISAYDLVRLIRLYGIDPDLAINPPASRVEVKRRLGPIAPAAQRAIRRAQLRSLPGGGEGELE